MITNVMTLFLLGTAMASDPFINNLKPSAYEVVVSGFKPHGCPMGADLAPLICKLMQTNMDLYYKPQLITSSTYIPQLIVQKCEAPEIKVDLELPANIGEEKPVLIPQPPELPPITIPKFSVPVITEELPEKIAESLDKPEMPLFHIPEPPQLPAVEMPVIPQIIDDPEPYSKEGILEIDYNSIEEKPMHIPEPPKLPAFKMPEFPVHVEIPSGPVLSAVDLPAPPVIAEKPDGGSFVNKKVISPEIDFSLVNFEPVSLPQAPIFPAFMMPEVPAISTYFQENPVAISPISTHFRPLATLPAAPELPVPVPMDFSQPIVVKEQREKEEPISDFDLATYQGVVVPQPPELPAFVMPELPSLSFEQASTKTYFEPLAPLPPAPELPPVSLPDFPYNVVIPPSPVLPPMDCSLPIVVKEDTIEEEREKEETTKSEFDLAAYQRVVVPQPPELPAFVMPELPSWSFEQVPIKTYFEPPAPLPPAPELPPVSLPDFPYNVVIPSAPVLPPMDFSLPILVKEDTIEEESEKEETPKSDFDLAANQRVVVPQPPELPAFVMPELPALSFEQAPIKTYFEPLAPLPPAPELPPVSLPDFPYNVVIPPSPVLPPMDCSLPIVVKEDTIEEEREKEETPKSEFDLAAYQRVVVPQPPELPAFVMPELPSLSFEQAPTKTYFEPLAPLPPAPELPPVSLPDFPYNIVIPSAPVLPPMDFSLPILVKEDTIEEESEKEETPKSDFDLAANQRVVVPQPPELPAFVMPELPALSFEQAPIKTYFEPLAPLPPVPELPPVSLPEFPYNFVIPSAPVLPPKDFSLPIVVKEDTIEEEREKEETPKSDFDLAAYQRVVVPQPPELPVFVMPELPSLSFEQAPIKTYFEPLAPLPPAPELPSVILPDFPYNVAIPSAPVIPAIDILSPSLFAEHQLPEIDHNMINRVPISIPSPPELPAFLIPELPVKVELPKVSEAPELPSVPKWPEFKPDFTAILPTFTNKPCESSGKLETSVASIAKPYFDRYFNDKIKESHNILIPTKTMIPESVTSPCLYNLVMYHVLPNLVSDNLRPWEKTKALTPSFVPCA